MLIKVQKNLEKLKIASGNQEGEILVAAVSGGADSVCLLLVLKQLEKQMHFKLEAIHVEHGIRGEESRRDALFVENLCQKLSVFCHVVHVDVPAYSKETGMGTEEAARVLRYQAFCEYARSKNAKIVLAHHMEDNAETVLFQMLRGSSLTGMCGISPIREDESGVCYLRPLLDIRRSEIEEYLKKEGQEYCTDSTNLETEYHRNYLRKEIIPRLNEINSAAVPHISQTAAQLGEVRDFLREEAEKAMKRLVSRNEKGVLLDAAGLKAMHPALQKEIIYETISDVAGSKKDIASAHVEEVRNLLLLQSGKRITLPYGIVAKRSFDTLILCKVEEESVKKDRLFVSAEMLERWEQEGLPVQVPLQSPGEVLLLKIFSYKGNPKEIPKKSCTKWMDYDKIKTGFCIRTRENGDFLINDISGHKKKLKKYFIDEKIPLEQRNTMWLLAQDAQVLWLVGGRISEHVKVTEETKTVIEIQYIGGN